MHRDCAPRRTLLPRPGLKHLAALLLGVLLPAVATAGSWPDTPLARTEALALLQTLNADLLSHDSATLTLERWCDAHHMASPATVFAHRVHGQDKPLPADLRAQLGIGAHEPVRYRRVQLACGDHVLSEADNWYLPARLTAAMNRELDSSDTPFGKVVRPLHFRRKTLSAALLWSPLPAGWEMRAAPAPSGRAGTLAIPHEVLQHRALLYDGAGHPFSALVETYTEQVLAFRTPRAASAEQATLHLPDLVSTGYSEMRLAVAPDGDTELWGSVDRPGGPGGWDIWMIRREHGRWSAPTPVSFDTPANEFDPAFSADGRTVWFFSNRPGGLGGDDIWSVPFDPARGRFGAPRNAGPAINSAGDEWAPSPSADGNRLLFASNGRGGAGRHDLFLATRRDGAWQAAVPLPGEVNTARDEFDATFVDDGRVLVYTRAPDVDNDPAELWFARRGADGGYHRPQRLDARINAAGGWAMGPAVDPRRPGVLLFSGKRPALSRGRSDIYEIAFDPPR
jgi:chorismate-pyruvate lyase